MALTVESLGADWGLPHQGTSPLNSRSRPGAARLTTNKKGEMWLPIPLTLPTGQKMLPWCGGSSWCWPSCFPQGHLNYMQNVYTFKEYVQRVFLSFRWDTTWFWVASILQTLRNTEQSTAPTWKNGTMRCDAPTCCEKSDCCVYRLLARQSLKGGFQGGRPTSGQWPLSLVLWVPSPPSPPRSLWGGATGM